MPTPASGIAVSLVAALHDAVVLSAGVVSNRRLIGYTAALSALLGLFALRALARPQESGGWGGGLRLRWSHLLDEAFGDAHPDRHPGRHLAVLVRVGRRRVQN